MKNKNVLLNKINELLLNKSPIVIAIDGRCGSGKTTLADELATIYNAQIVRMDHFFLPPKLRTPQRLSQPGGNVHYERFSQQVVSNLPFVKSFSYDIFDCRVKDFVGKSTIANCDVIIIEGVYSMRPEFIDTYDIKVFIDITPPLQEQRIIKRNGDKIYNVFKEVWIPLEEIYFNHYSVKQIADIIIEN